MKKFASILVLLGGVASFQAASAAEKAPNQLRECFRAHAHLTAKPAVGTMITCWHAHGGLMEHA